MIITNFTGTRLLYFCKMFATCFVRQTLRHWHLNNNSALAVLWFYLRPVRNWTSWPKMITLLIKIVLDVRCKWPFLELLECWGPVGTDPLKLMQTFSQLLMLWSRVRLQAQKKSICLVAINLEQLNQKNRILKSWVQTAVTISIMKSFHELVANLPHPGHCRSSAELYTTELNKLSLRVDKFSRYQSEQCLSFTDPCECPRFINFSKSNTFSNWLSFPLAILRRSSLIV